MDEVVIVGSCTYWDLSSWIQPRIDWRTAKESAEGILREWHTICLPWKYNHWLPAIKVDGAPKLSSIRSVFTRDMYGTALGSESETFHKKFQELVVLSKISQRLIIFWECLTGGMTAGFWVIPFKQVEYSIGGWPNQNNFANLDFGSTTFDH
jgi:hypothetical protein